jgi:P4 family phage/plasmid primase-like protien
MSNSDDQSSTSSSRRRPNLRVIASDGALTERSGVAPLAIGSDLEISQRVAIRLKKQHRDVVGCEGELWRYDGTCWVAIPGDELRRLVHRFDGAPIDRGPNMPGLVRLTRSRISSILSEVMVICENEHFFARPEAGINCHSGFIAFDTSGEPKLVPHDRGHRVQYVVRGKWPTKIEEAAYKSSLLCRLFEGAFLGDPDAQEKTQLVAEIGAAAALGLATRLREPKAIVFFGPTAGNGKSACVEMLRGFLPDKVVASVPAQKFHDERHLVRLAGRLLNSADELGAKAVSSSVFKQLVTGEPLAARDVYKSAINFRCRAVHVFATNALPMFRGGMDRGVRRRILAVGFNRVIPQNERIPDIARRICDEEPDLLLNLVVQAAMRLIRESAFTCPASSDALTREWFLGSDPVLAWAEERIVADANAERIPTRDAFCDFKRWAASEGFARLPEAPAFTQRLIAAVPGIKNARSNTKRYLTGFRFREPVTVREWPSG